MHFEGSSRFGLNLLFSLLSTPTLLTSPQLSKYLFLGRKVLSVRNELSSMVIDIYHQLRGQMFKSSIT